MQGPQRAHFAMAVELEYERRARMVAPVLAPMQRVGVEHKPAARSACHRHHAPTSAALELRNVLVRDARSTPAGATDEIVGGAVRALGDERRPPAGVHVVEENKGFDAPSAAIVAAR